MITTSYARGLNGDHKVRGLNGSKPTGRFGGLPHGWQLRQPTRLQTRRGRELHLLQVWLYSNVWKHKKHRCKYINYPQRCIPSLVCGYSCGPPIRLAEERLPRSFCCSLGARPEVGMAVQATRQDHSRLHRTEHLAHRWPDHPDGTTQRSLSYEFFTSILDNQFLSDVDSVSGAINEIQQFGTK